MKRLSVLLVLFLLLAGVPGVQAAAEAVPGVRILVTGTDATDAFYTIRFAVSPDDPNQDTGDYTYNYTRLITGGSWNTHESDVAVSGGFGEVTDDLTLGQEVTVNITADANDGTGPVDSCTVTLTLTESGQFDACGTLDSDGTFSEYFCLETTATETGFNFEERLELEGVNIKYDSGFGTSVSRLAKGALNLGGDTTELRLVTEHRFASEGAIGEFRVFFSEVDLDAGSSSFGNGENSGAFRDGISFEFNENGDDYDVGIFKVVSGAKTSLIEKDNLDAGNTNIFSDMVLTVDTTADLLILEIGADSIAVDPQASLSAFQTLWVVEGYEDSLSDSYTRSGDSFCLHTSQENVAQPGLPGDAGQGIEDFEGEGGVTGDPMFPGLSVTDQAAALDLEEAVFAWILAGLAILGFAFLGFMVASIGGAGLGAVLGLVASVVFNLIPLWLIVILFLLAVTVIVFGVKAGD